MKLFASIKSGLERVVSSTDFRKSLIYVVASMLGYGVVFLQNFSLAYFLSIAFFGKITLIVSLFSTLYILFTFGLNAVVQRFYFDKLYASDKRTLISHVAALWLCLSVVLLIISMVIGYLLLVVQSLLPIDYNREFIPVLFGAFLFSFTEIYPNLFVVQGRPVPYAIWLISSRSTIFILVHAAVYFFGESSFHISLMLLISGAILTISGIIAFKIFPIVPLKGAALREILRYAFPLMIYALGGIGYSHGYRVIISKWLSYQDLALFTMANQIAMVYYLIAVSCVIGFQPKAYKALAEQHGHPRAARFYLQILLLAGLGIAILMLPVGYVFLKFFKGGSFLSAFNILPILLGAQFLYFLYGYNYILSTYHKKTRLLTYSMLVGVMTSLFLTSIFLDASSLLSAAVPIICGITIQFLISFIAIRKIALKAAIKEKNGNKDE